MKAHEIATAAAKLLSVPGQWCQMHLALDENGSEIDANHERACRWCLVGGVYAVAGTLGKSNEETDRLFKTLGRITDCLEIGDWNDRTYRKQQEVVDVLLMAARVLEPEDTGNGK